MLEENIFKPQLTKDGSYTFFSDEFQEAFHSHSGAKLEADEKYIKPCQLAQLAKTNQSLNLLDICYGLGYNSASALETIWNVNPQCKIKLIGLELESSVPNQAIDSNLLELWHSPIQKLLTELGKNLEVNSTYLEAKLLIGDARKTMMLLLENNFQADAIFLDPFSPPKCPQLWTVEFIKLASITLKTTGKLATYSCAASVRKAFLLAGLNIGSTPAVGRRAQGTIASFDTENLPPLSQQEEEHLQTRASIPYRDPLLSDSALVLHQRREKEQHLSNLESTSQWKKRWLKN